MTRQDFQLIADVFNEAREWSEGYSRDESCRRILAERMADKLATTNERFDRARFLKACGVEA
jgi:hypothetical protein